MVKNKKGLISLFIIAVVIIAAALYWNYRSKPTVVGAKQLGEKEKLEDFNYVYNTLKDNFPYFEIEKRKTGFDWLGHKAEFEKQIKKTKNDVEFYKAMNEIFMQVQNAHTGLIGSEWLKNMSDMYDGSTEWNKVLSNKKVKDKNTQWEQLLKKQSTYYLPVGFVYMEGKYMAVKIPGADTANLKINNGDTLKKINNIDIDSYVKGLINKTYLNFDSERNKVFVNQLVIQSHKEAQYTLTFVNAKGETVAENVKAAIYSESSSNQNAAEKNKDNIYTKVLKDKSVAYLRVKSMMGDYNKDNLRIYEFFKSIKDFPYLIIDIRGNGGGNDLYWTQNILRPLIDKEVVSKEYIVFRDGEYIKPFINEKVGSLEASIPDDIKNIKGIGDNFKSIHTINKSITPANTADFHGKILLLVDSYVYSSSESFAVFAKDTKFAILIGTTTGGDGIGVDPVVASMPNSKLVFRFPMDMGINPDYTINEEAHTKPDIFVEQSYSDAVKYIEWECKNQEEYINPYDTILNKTLKLIEDGGIN